MSKRVMVVDDSRLVRVQLGDVLKGTDYEIAAYCRSGEDAIAQYDQIKPDLVTMDIIMTGMDGLDASEIILKQHPDARIVMCTAMGQQSMVVEAIKYGAKDFIVKPFNAERIVEAANQILG